MRNLGEIQNDIEITKHAQQEADYQIGLCEGTLDHWKTVKKAAENRLATLSAEYLRAEGADPRTL